MTAPEFRTALVKIGWGQNQASTWFGVSERTGRYWCDPRGDGPPESVAMWVDYIRALNLDPAEIRAAIDAYRARQNETPN